MGELTNVKVQGFITAGKAVAKSDGDGLTFTLSASGRASWVLRYRFGGKAKEKTIGQYPDISLAEARKLAMADRSKVQQGIDVAAEKQKSKREAASAWTFRQLAEDYLKKAEGRLAKTTLDGRRQQLRDYVYPIVGNRSAKDIEPHELATVVERVVNKSRHVARLVLVAIPVLILCAGAVAAGGVHRKISNPSPQAIMKIALAAGVVAVVASYLGYSEGQKFRNGIDEGVDAKQDKSRQAMPATHSVRDKGYYMRGFQQRMTREEVLAVFGPPEIANDSMLAYRAVRPENGKDTLCFFYFSSDYTVDGRSRVSELRC